MSVEIVETLDCIKIRVHGYDRITIPKADVEVVLDYYKHRLKSSKKYWIDLWQMSICRNNKFRRRFTNLWDYRGGSLSKEDLADAIEKIERDILNVPIDKDYLKTKDVRFLVSLLARVGG